MIFSLPPYCCLHLTDLVSLAVILNSCDELGFFNDLDMLG